MQTLRPIRDPRRRRATVDAFTSAIGDDNVHNWLTMMKRLTPVRLLPLPKATIRGKKSLTRVQQHMNRRRFKQRTAA